MVTKPLASPSNAAGVAVFDLPSSVANAIVTIKMRVAFLVF